MNLILLFSYSVFVPLGQYFILDNTIYYSELNCPRSTLTCSQSVFNILIIDMHPRSRDRKKGCMSKLSKLFSQNSITYLTIMQTCRHILQEK